MEERRSDGSVLTSVYDRGRRSDPRAHGAGTEAATSFDGRGMAVRVERPRGRGYTLYSYDLDGSRLREATRTAAAGLWETAYALRLDGSGDDGQLRRRHGGDADLQPRLDGGDAARPGTG